MIRRRLAHALDRRFEALHHRVERLEDEVRQTRERLDHELYPTLRILAGRDSENRRLLAEARSADEYRLAWDNPNPLVTVIIPTFGRPELLRSRALPAVLGQTYERLEVLVVGDGPNPEAEAVVREVDDPRLHWANTSQRYVYPTNTATGLPRRRSRGTRATASPRAAGSSTSTTTTRCRPMRSSRCSRRRWRAAPR